MYFLLLLLILGAGDGCGGWGVQVAFLSSGGAPAGVSGGFGGGEQQVTGWSQQWGAGPAAHPRGSICCGQASDSPFFRPSSPASLSSDWLLLRARNCPSAAAGLGRLDAAIKRLCSSKSWWWKISAGEEQAGQGPQRRSAHHRLSQHEGTMQLCASA